MTHRTSHQLTHACAAILMGAVAVACSGAKETTGNPRTAQGGGDRGRIERVRVEGCLQEAPGTPGREYVLAHATMPEPETQPQGQETMAHGPLVANGSWVRLKSDAQDMKSYLGQRVAVTGEVIDRGENTLGTSGRTTPAREGTTDAEKMQQSSKDAHTDPGRTTPPSTVAPMGANANGTAPLIAVEQVEKATGDGSCEATDQNAPKAK